jgi:ATP-dependent RNA helicase RhlE
MLVLSPTRELAAQIADNMRGYAKYLNMSVQCVFGGVPVGKQARMLVAGVDVLVATPGRLLDLNDQRALTLRHVEIFVLDEADQMMDLGFIHALRRVSQLLPEKRQSLFFSATMPQAIAQLGSQFIKNPVRVEVTPQASTAERVVQRATFVNQAEKQALLTIRLRALTASGELDRSLVFTRTKHGADRVVRNLVAAGVEAAAIHGNKSQAQRTAALGKFRSGNLRVLVATDIAARGIDVTGVSHVFNFELPNVAEQYVHRIGRTARAGADGIAESFVAPDEKAYLRDIEKLTGIKLDQMPLPEGFQAEAAKLPKAARTNPDSDQPRRGEHGNRNGPRNYVREEGDGRSRARRNNGPHVARTDTSAIRPVGAAAPRGDARRDGPAQDRRAPRPHGDNRPARPQGDSRPARPQGDSRPARPHGDARPAAGGQGYRGPRGGGSQGGSRY